MGKKQNTFREIDIQKKGTLLQKFETFLQKHKKKSDVIDFLGVMNAKYIGMTAQRELTEEEKTELLEFADYFNENFLELMEYEIEENWFDLPYVLRLAEKLEYEDYVKERKEYIENTNSHLRKEAKTLADTIFEIRENRHITCVYHDGNEVHDLTLDLPKTIYRESIADAKEELLYLLLMTISGRGGITVRLFKGKRCEVFGIGVLPIEVWYPIGKEEMQKFSCTTPNGIELEPEENVTYTEIQRTRF